MRATGHIIKGLTMISLKVISRPLVILALVLGVTSTSAADGILRVSTTNPRYFTDNSGKAIYLTGAHTWASFFEKTEITQAFDYTDYLTFLQEKNHNLIRAWSWGTAYQKSGEDVLPYFAASPRPWPRTGPGNAADGQLKFNLSQHNQSYFTRLRQRTIEAKNRNIYVAVMLFEGWCLAGDERGQRDCWTWHPFKTTNNINGITADTNGDGEGFEFYKSNIPTAAKNIQKAYIAKVVDTLHDLDNVLYEIVNEASVGSVSWQSEMVNFLKDYESSKGYSHHPVGITAMSHLASSGSNSVLFDSPADWISPANIAGSEDYKTNPPTSTGTKVVLSDTDHLWGVGGDRRWVWKSFLRALGTLYMEFADLTEDTDPERVGAMNAMGQTLAFAKRIDLIHMLPKNSLSSTTYCLANEGKEYLAYQPNTGSFTVNVSSGTYSYEWFNPQTGNVVATGTLTASGGSKQFSPPFTGDAVLYLKTATITPAAPTSLRVK